MRPEDFSEDAPGIVVPIPRSLTPDRMQAGAPDIANLPTRSYAFVPNPLPPELTYAPALVSTLVRASSALGRLDTVVQALPNPSLLARPLLRREAVESSRIEGTIATLDDLVLFEETRPRDDRTQADVREVANYVAAFEYGLQQPPERGISVGLIRELHQILLAGVRGDHLRPGTIRSTQNVIGQRGDTVDTARFVPPPPRRSSASCRTWKPTSPATSMIRPWSGSGWSITNSRRSIRSSTETAESGGS